MLAQLAAWLIVAYVGFALLWERWAADVAESHTTYTQLVRFRSPQALSSWVTALLAVLDSAALFLPLSPRGRAGDPGPAVLRRACLARRLGREKGRGPGWDGCLVWC